MTYRHKKFATDRLSARAVRLIWQLSILKIIALYRYNIKLINIILYDNNLC